MPEPKEKLPSVEYTIDNHNRLIHFGGDWDQFAQENEGENLSAAKLHMQHLFDHIGDPNLHQLWHAIIQRVRGKKEAAEFNYRCDSPGLRRFMRMRVFPADDHIHFKSTVLRTETRPELKILEKKRPHSKKLLIVCSWCKNIKAPDETWLEPEVAVSQLGILEEEPLPEISHGICPECTVRVTEQLDVII